MYNDVVERSAVQFCTDFARLARQTQFGVNMQFVLVSWYFEDGRAFRMHFSPAAHCAFTHADHCRPFRTFIRSCVCIFVYYSTDAKACVSCGHSHFVLNAHTNTCCESHTNMRCDRLHVGKFIKLFVCAHVCGKGTCARGTGLLLDVGLTNTCSHKSKSSLFGCPYRTLPDCRLLCLESEAKYMACCDA